MGETLLFLLGGLFSGAGVCLIWAALRTRRQARENFEKIEWALEQLERALGQIQSEDEDEILAGLQVLATLNDPGVRFKALPRLSELAQSDNPHISRYARVAIAKLIHSEEGTPEGDK